jgi:hypothetical protein
MVDEIIREVKLSAELEEEIRRSRPSNLESTESCQPKHFEDLEEGLDAYA